MIEAASFANTFLKLAFAIVCKSFTHNTHKPDVA